MVHHSEALLACLDAVRPRTIVEVGAYAGDLTRVLVDWASRHGGGVTAVDPAPQSPLVELAERRPELQLRRQTSLDALPEIELPEVVIIDGDHNYYTVSEELRIVGERAPDTQLPLLLFHDVCWPHGRRDDYFDPQQIPAEYRHTLVGAGAGLVPGDPGVRADGLPYPKSAAREGGPRNGVLTAVEDFVTQRQGLRLVVIPAFFGFGAVWHTDATWSERLDAVLGPWDRQPLLERLEENRTEHIAQEHALRVALWDAQGARTRRDAVLERLLESSAFAVAERLSRLRVRARIAPSRSVVSKAEIRRAMQDRPPTPPGS
jgi:hypothetical protein